MSSPAPVLSLEEACRFREDLESQGKRLVFTNGCFDILHAGHVRYLAQARALGDALLVAVNSDDSVRQLKGPERPVNSLQNRLEVIRSLKAVDAVVVFHEPRTTLLLQRLRPPVFAKGGDYSLETTHAEERAALESFGAEIHFLPQAEGLSTSRLLSRVRFGDSVPSRLSRFPTIVGSVSEIVDQYKAVLLDQWGVLHNGVSLLPGVPEFFRRLRKAGIPAFIITNSSKPASYNRTRLQEKFGLAPDQYEMLVSSFDVMCDQMLARDQFPVYVIAAEGEERFLSAAGIPVTESLASARSVAILSIEPTASVEPFKEVAAAVAKRRLPLFSICNDKTCTVAGQLHCGISRLVDLFSAESEVIQAGKPEPFLYVKCLEKLPGIDPREILAVGDQLEPDITGASAAAIDSALVLSGAVRQIQIVTPQDAIIPIWITAAL